MSGTEEWNRGSALARFFVTTQKCWKTPICTATAEWPKSKKRSINVKPSKLKIRRSINRLYPNAPTVLMGLCALRRLNRLFLCLVLRCWVRLVSKERFRALIQGRQIVLSPQMTVNKIKLVSPRCKPLFHPLPLPWRRWIIQKQWGQKKILPNSKNKLLNLTPLGPAPVKLMNVNVTTNCRRWREDGVPQNILQLTHTRLIGESLLKTPRL